MAIARRLAVALLNAVVRCAPADVRAWGQAMVRELDVVENDRAALSWALGSTTALMRQPAMLRTIARNAGGVFLGAVMAGGVFVVSGAGLLRLLFLAFPSWQAQPRPIVEWLTAIAVPEMVFVVAVMTLRRHRRFMAAGIMLSAIALFIHFFVHVAA